MPFRPSLRIAIAAVALLAPSASEAIAQDDGVRVDPDSPAGKEYALPLDSARRDAAGTPSAGARDEAPLFGAGISKQESQRGSRRARRASGGDGGGGEGSGASTDRDTGASRPPAAVTETASGGPPAGLLTALIALGVLAAGGLIGLLLRARGTHQAG